MLFPVYDDHQFGELSTCQAGRTHSRSSVETASAEGRQKDSVQDVCMVEMPSDAQFVEPEIQKNSKSPQAFEEVQTVAIPRIPY